MKLDFEILIHKTNSLRSEESLEDKDFKPIGILEGYYERVTTTKLSYIAKSKKPTFLKMNASSIIGPK